MRMVKASSLAPATDTTFVGWALSAANERRGELSKLNHRGFRVNGSQIRQVDFYLVQLTLGVVSHHVE